MRPRGPVIVATDGSARSHRVLPHATLLAKAVAARLTLLTVLDGPPDAKTAELEMTLSRLGIEGDARVETLRPREKTAAALVRVARETDAVLLALDSRGHGALRAALYGSVAVDLLRAVELPLLLSGPNLEPPPAVQEPYRLVVTHDGSPAAGAVLLVLAPLLTAARFAVSLLRVHETEPAGMENDAAVARCMRELEEARRLLPAKVDVKMEVREIARGGGIDTAIIETALVEGAHAIAMSTQGHSARRHIVLGSLAMTMLGRSRLPLLLSRADVR